MKAFFTRILSTALCFILAFAVIQPAFAEGTDDFVDYDAPYIAFLQQTNPDGVTNEEEIEAAKQRAFDAFDGIILGPTNDGWSHISPIFTGGYYVETARFWYQYQCLPGNTKIGLITIRPDLYGSFNVSGTPIQQISIDADCRTHISSVIVDDCTSLTSLFFMNQAYCTEVSALNCPSLVAIRLTNCGLRKISVKKRGFSKPLTLLSFGSGTVGMHNRRNDLDTKEIIVLATPAEGENFLGWYEDGSLVSTDSEYRRTGGGKLYACFAGDADGNGQINTVDATLIMRAALGYTSVNNFSMMDVDADGNIAVADALAVLRVSLGL